MRRPLIPLAIALAAGIVFGRYVDTRGEFFGLSALVIVLLFLAGRFLFENPPNRLLFVAAALALYGAVASSHGEFDEPGPEHLVAYAGRGKLSMEAVIDGIPTRRVDRIRFPLRVEKIHLPAEAYVPVEGRALLSVAEGGEGLRYGDRILFTSKIREISPYGNPGAFRVDRYFREKGIRATVYLRRGSQVQILERDLGSPFWRGVEALRGGIRARLEAQLISPQREIVMALLIGESGVVPEEVRRVFRDAGVAHLLAVSGLHMGIVAAGTLFLAFFVLRRSSRVLLAINAMKLAAGIALIPTFGYCLLAGAKFSAIRASIMVGILLLAIIVDRHRDILSAIALAAIAILVLRPAALFQAGFQLSFVAVTAIVLVVPTILRRRRRNRDPLDEAFPSRGLRFVDALVVALATPLAAGLATAPITAWHFNNFAAFGLLSNVLLVPLYSFFIIPFSFLGMVLMPLSLWLSQFVLDLAVYAINTGYHFTRFVASLPGATFRVNTPTLLEIFAYFGLIAALVTWRKGRFPRFGAAACALVLLLVPAGYRLSDWLDQDLRFTLIDVGGGLSQLIEFPGGKKVLIDGGGKMGPGFDVGEGVLAPFLWKRRINAFDLVINTHPHADHFGGLIFLLRHFRVKELWITGLDLENGKGYRELLRVARARGVPTRVVHDGVEPRKLGPATLSIIWPPASVYQDPDISINDASLVIRIDHGRNGFLLCSDIEKWAEERLLEDERFLDATVLVAPHHGAKTSSTLEFVRDAHPEFVLVSSGRDNRFGHPDRKVLNRYRAARSAIFRTDQQGRILCRSDAVNVRCEPFWKEKRRRK